MAKLIAANYNSTTSTAYGFMTTHNISLKNNTTYTLVARYKYTKNNSSGPQIILHESSWSAGQFAIYATHSDMAVSTKVFTAPANAENYSWAIYCYSWSYENNNGTGGKDGVLAIDWYELWEGDVTQFSLTDAIGLSGAGVNLMSNGRYPNSLSGIYANGGTRSIDTSKFGYSVIKCVASTGNTQIYFYPGLEVGKTYLASVDVYTDDDVTSCNIKIEKSTIHGYYRTIGKKSWSRVWVLATKTEVGGAITLYGPAGTFYYKNIKVCEAPMTALHSSVWTPSASELNEYIGFTNTDFTTSFKTLQNDCKNNNYFTNSTNGKTSLRNWMGYYSSLGYGFTTSLSTTSVAASGGSITVNYTVKENWTNGKTATPKAGVTPTITSSIGTVSDITATDANGNGTAKITVASRGTTVGAAQTGTVSVSFGGVTKTATFTRALNKVTSVEKLSTPKMTYANIAAGGGTSTPTNSGFTARFYYSSGSYGDPNGYKVTHSYSWNGASGTFTALNTSTGVITASTRGTTIGNAVSSPTVTHSAVFEYTNPTEVGGNKVSVTLTGTAACTQEANAVTAVESQVHDNTHPAHFYYINPTNISAAGDTRSRQGNGCAVLTFTSGSKSDKIGSSGTYYGGSLSFTRTFTESSDTNNMITLASNGNVTIASRGTTVGAARSATVSGTLTATFGNLTDSLTHTVTLTQQANDVTSYGTITVTSHGSVSGDIPASGGSRTASGGTGTQTITYTSTDTRPGSVTCGTYSTVSADSLGTTVKARTKIGDSTATLTGEGGKTASVSVAVYQEANTVTKVTAVVKDTAVSSAHFTYGAYSSARAIPATGVNNLAVVDNGAAILTFTSGDESGKLTAGTYYGGTLSFSRVFYFNDNTSTLSSNGFTINKTTGALTVTNNTSTSAREISRACCDLTATWGSLSHTIQNSRKLKQNAGAMVYGGITITGGYSSTIARTGGSVTPAISYSQSYTWNGVAGSGGAETTGATVTYSKSSSNDGFTLDSTSTGKVTAIANDGSIDPILGHTQLHYWPTAARSTNINVNISKNGKSANKTLVVSQTGNGIKTISFTAGAGMGGQLGAVSSFTSAAGSKTVPSTTPANVNDKLTAILATYTLEANPSGVKTATFTNVPILDYINYSGPTYSWSSNGSWATVSGTAATSTVSVTANTGALRTATITRNGSFAVTLKPEYKSSSFIGSDSATVTGAATTTVSQAAGVIKQERSVYYGSYPSSLYVLGGSGSLAFQTGANTSFSSSSYTIPGVNGNDEYTGITLTETDSTKASSFYIYLNNIQIGMQNQVAPRLHLRVGVKSGSYSFTETWYDQYFTADSVVYQNGVYVATWGTSNYAVVNIPASSNSNYCHIDIQFTT